PPPPPVAAAELPAPPLSSSSSLLQPCTQATASTRPKKHRRCRDIDHSPRVDEAPPRSAGAWLTIFAALFPAYASCSSSIGDPLYALCARTSTARMLPPKLVAPLLGYLRERLRRTCVA